MKSVLHSLINFQDQTIFVHIKHVKNIHLKINEKNEIILTIPHPKCMDQAQLFLQSKWQWVSKVLDGRTRNPQFISKKYCDNEIFYLLGKPLKLKIVPIQAPITRFFYDDQYIYIEVRPNLKYDFSKIIDTLYKNVVIDFIHKNALAWQQKLNVTVSQYDVKKFTARWGCCYYWKHKIALNSLLAPKPPHLIEYVLVHELVHLLEPGHGPRFYNLMNLYLPNWQELKKELNKN
ncbi:MAG: SprT family zinc-dependent metalloprotease [Alphaproteobacteria bacterium]|nr:SprT family zinc-dependent metalloprotease [Alphaproteobacteria bacterium]